MPGTNSDKAAEVALSVSIPRLLYNTTNKVITHVQIKTTGK